MDIDDFSDQNKLAWVDKLFENIFVLYLFLMQKFTNYKIFVS
jgi:hypothetical protein